MIEMRISVNISTRARPTVCLLKMGHFQPLFLYFRLFNTVDSKMFNIFFCQWPDSNSGPLKLEATAVPTEPQPLPDSLFIAKNHCYAPCTYLKSNNRLDHFTIGTLKVLCVKRSSFSKIFSGCSVICPIGRPSDILEPMTQSCNCCNKVL